MERKRERERVKIVHKLDCFKIIILNKGIMSNILVTKINKIFIVYILIQNKEKGKIYE